MLLGGITPSASNNSATDSRSEDPNDCCGFRGFDNGGTLALYGSYEFHQWPILVRYGQVGDGERRKKIVTLVNDWTPGVEAEKAFTDVAVKGGAEIVARASRATGESGFCPVLATYARSQA